ncbi:hypothetical protein [Luteimonas sp. R10]|uniref:hypothetical protein n=1 Tax=Luteimonas sp. R10 TaxID=3108176 RepID=UPI00308507E6|nr:hypothetical protein U3649_02790 [Luteimonas sp. R10]
MPAAGHARVHRALHVIDGRTGGRSSIRGALADQRSCDCQEEIKSMLSATGLDC